MGCFGCYASDRGYRTPQEADIRFIHIYDRIVVLAMYPITIVLNWFVFVFNAQKLH